MKKLLVLGSGLIGLGMIAMRASAQVPEIAFNLVPQPKFLACLAGPGGTPTAQVIVQRGELSDVLILQAQHLKPNLGFDLSRFRTPISWQMEHWTRISRTSVWPGTRQMFRLTRTATRRLRSRRSSSIRYSVLIQPLAWNRLIHFTSVSGSTSRRMRRRADLIPRTRLPSTGSKMPDQTR